MTTLLPRARPAIATGLAMAALVSSRVGDATGRDGKTAATRDRFLLLDSRVIAHTENARLAVGTVAKHEANPLFGEDKPWEKRFDNLYGNVVFDEQDQLYKCWYSPFTVDHSARGMTLEQRQGPYPPPRGREMSICYATSRDGLTWQKPNLGLVAIHAQRPVDRVWTELAWSADTRAWHRISEGTPLIPCSEKKLDYDYGCVYACATPVFLEDEIRLYYGGSDWLHYGWRNGSLALATLRPDGFAGFEPKDGDGPAIITTTALPCEGRTIKITADVKKGGSVRASIVDADGKAIAHAETITGTVTDEPLKLDREADPGEIRIKLEFRKAKVYSIAF